MQNVAMQNKRSDSWLNIKKDFNTMTWVLMPVAIAINMAVGQIVATLRLPVYLDSIGTVLVGVICGPWAGALTGALANTILGLTINPDFLPGWLQGFAKNQPFTLLLDATRGLLTGYPEVGNKGWMVTLYLAIATVILAPIAMWMYERRIRR